MGWDWRDHWRKITLVRHRSELRALRLARRWRYFALAPIFLTLAFWWFALWIPLSVVVLPVFSMALAGKEIANLLALILMMPLSVAISAVLIGAFPWFFRWYFIALSLSMGRTTMADQKETELIAAISST